VAGEERKNSSPKGKRRRKERRRKGRSTRVADLIRPFILGYTFDRAP
jgi:hypothetical protein